MPVETILSHSGAAKRTLHELMISRWMLGSRPGFATCGRLRQIMRPMNLLTMPGETIIADDGTATRTLQKITVARWVHGNGSGLGSCGRLRQIVYSRGRSLGAVHALQMGQIELVRFFLVSALRNQSV